jgi:hypothetical protein
MADGAQQAATNQMSRHVSPEEAQRAARELASLMEKQLGYVDGHIDSIALRLFIRAYWNRVSVLAHTIHDET